MTTRSALLGSVLGNGAAGVTTIFTVPAGERWVIKSIRGWASATTTVYFYVDAGAGDQVVAKVSGSGDFQVVVDPCWLVVESGDSFKAYLAVVSANESLYVSGARLPNP